MDIALIACSLLLPEQKFFGFLIRVYLCSFVVAFATDEIQQRFNSPAFSEAAEVLNMIQRTPEQRSQYELRLKAQRDDQARLQHARAEGEAKGRAEGVAEGRAEGELAGQIKLLCQLLGKETSSLDGLSNDELGSLMNDLKKELRDRGT